MLMLVSIEDGRVSLLRVPRIFESNENNKNQKGSFLFFKEPARTIQAGVDSMLVSIEDGRVPLLRVTRIYNSYENNKIKKAPSFFSREPARTIQAGGIQYW